MAKRKGQAATGQAAPPTTTIAARVVAALAAPRQRAPTPDRLFAPLRELVGCLIDVCEALHREHAGPHWQAAATMLGHVCDDLRDPAEPLELEFLRGLQARQAARANARRVVEVDSEETRQEKLAAAAAVQERRVLEQLAHLEAEQRMRDAMAAAKVAEIARRAPRKPQRSVSVTHTACADAERSLARAAVELQRVRSSLGESASIDETCRALPARHRGPR